MKNFDFTIDEFSGPLELLLSLVDEKKKDITEISLSQVTEQFLRYIDSLSEKNPEELTDFLVVASRLLLLKARMLLPYFTPEEDEDEISLERQLRLYRAFMEVGKDVNSKWMSHERGYVRHHPIQIIEDYVHPRNVSLESLGIVMQSIIHRLKPKNLLLNTYIDKNISIKEKIERIRTLLKNKKSIFFTELVDDMTNKTDIIVSFLALLELSKRNQVSIKQSKTFSDISLQIIN